MSDDPGPLAEPQPAPHEIQTPGWAKPKYAMRAHFYEKGKAACGKSRHFGAVSPEPLGGMAGACRLCCQRLAQRAIRANPAPDATAE